jgi:hypothetical protein
MSAIDWDICLEGRCWSTEELRSRYDLIPEKIELIQGKLFWSEEARLNRLGLLLDNVGVETAIRLRNSDIEFQTSRRAKCAGQSV